MGDLEDAAKKLAGTKVDRETFSKGLHLTNKNVNLSPNDVRKQMGLYLNAPKDCCRVCGEYIHITIFRGDGWCCDDHRKVLKGEAPWPK